MRVSIGSDHAGYALKKILREYLEKSGFQVIDLGPDNEQSVDYPDFAESVALSVQKGEAKFGILVCGTGLGMAITANKIKGIRAVTVTDCYSAKMARAHNDANILALGSRVVGSGLAQHLVEVFLNTEFEGGRHLNRIRKICQLEEDAE
jgi:ribose 5-phosphate isomerase B